MATLLALPSGEFGCASFVHATGFVAKTIANSAAIMELSVGIRPCL
jgi:hypothetical protein